MENNNNERCIVACEMFATDTINVNPDIDCGVKTGSHINIMVDRGTS